MATYHEGVRIFVPVPKECMGSVIGVKGHKIKKIRDDTGTSITTYQGNEIGTESGFWVLGTGSNCERAFKAIKDCVGNAEMKIFETVDREFVGAVIGKQRNNINKIKEECNVRVTWENDRENNVIFTVEGSRLNCETAREMIKQSAARRNVDRVIDGEKQFRIESHFVPMIIGKKGQTRARLETKSGTKIKVISPKESDPAVLRIIGSPDKIQRAEWLMKNLIANIKEYVIREELGGNKHFYYFNHENKNEKFCLKEGGDIPKLDTHLRGSRYRIENDSGINNEIEFSKKTINDIKSHLKQSLQNLHALRNEKELIIDLWCHFGKVFVSNVDPDEVPGNITIDDVNEQLPYFSNQERNEHENARWTVSFEEGVDPDRMGEEWLSELEEDEHEFLKLFHTQWRYDFGFVTPTERNVRLKIWEGLPAGRDEPPDEVKYVIMPVSIREVESSDVKAWLCYPSRPIVKGEIMIPNSSYDCRMKLRAGSRMVTEDKKTSEDKEEDLILTDYLSNITFDKENHCMKLPDEAQHECPDGFQCLFYRQSEERMFSAKFDDNTFTVIVLEEQGWDSDSSTRRQQNQHGIRVVMDSWSKALLSPERKWEPDEILDKLEDYMKFLSLLQSHLFQ